MHFLSSLLSKQEIRNQSQIQLCIENNKWWLDYLDDSDLRIEYAKEILAIDDEEHEKDDDVANYYFQLLQQHPSSSYLHFFTITIIRMIHDGLLTSSLPLQPIIEELLPVLL